MTIIVIKISRDQRNATKLETHLHATKELSEDVQD